MAKKHSSEAFYALDDHLKAAVFSVLLELMNVQICRKIKVGAHINAEPAARKATEEDFCSYLQRKER